MTIRLNPRWLLISVLLFSLQFCRAQTEIPPYVSVSQLQGQVGMLAEDQPELSRFDAKSMVDNSVLKKLEDSGWIKRLFR